MTYLVEQSRFEEEIPLPKSIHHTNNDSQMSEIYNIVEDMNQPFDEYTQQLSEIEKQVSRKQTDIHTIQTSKADDKLITLNHQSQSFQKPTDDQTQQYSKEEIHQKNSDDLSREELTYVADDDLKIKQKTLIDVLSEVKKSTQGIDRIINMN